MRAESSPSDACHRLEKTELSRADPSSSTKHTCPVLWQKGLVLPILLALGSCTSSIEPLSEPQAQTPLVLAPQAKQTRPAMPVPKDAKLLEPGTRVNDYVNQNLPSQLPHTLQQLNDNPSASAYPVIKDVPEPSRKLKTLDERKKLEEELRDLAQ